MSLLSDAFSGFKANSDIREEVPTTAHGKLIHEVLLLLAQIQRDTRVRRCKEVHVKLQDAERLLRSFQKEEWPRKKSAPLSSIDTSNPQVRRYSEDMDETDATADPSVFETDSVSVDVMSATPGGEDPLGHMLDDDQSIMPHNPVEDDPQTRETMHNSVISLLETLVILMCHSSKLHKASTFALEIIQKLTEKRYISGRAGGQDDVSGSGSNQNAGQEASLLHRILVSIAKVADMNVEAVHVPVIHTLKTIMTSNKCGVHEENMLLAFKTTFHVYLVSRVVACKRKAKIALVDMLRSVLSRMEGFEVVTKSQATNRSAPPSPARPDPPSGGVNAANSSDPSNLISASFASQYHTDSYILFRTICKLSSKELHADTANDEDRASFLFTQIMTDPLALNNKILSLELILASLKSCGPAFCEGDRFIHLVQHYLCSSLLKNCMSNQTQVAFLSQKIFLVLISKFKVHLKQEIEVFLSNIFLKVLDSPNSSFKQKGLVLEALRSLGSDPGLLTQIFLNYDCDFDSMNLYKDIIHMLTKLGSKASIYNSGTTTKESEQELELSVAGMEVLVTTLKAMLRVLSLPGGDDDESDDSAGKKIRLMINLEPPTTSDVGSTADELPSRDNTTSVSGTESMSEDTSLPERVSTAVGDFEEIGSSEVAGKIVDAFELKRTAEQNFEIGAVKFTLSLKSGLNFFIDNGFVKREAREVALFFLVNKDKLDKTQMGEALGREPDSAFVKDHNVDPDHGGRGYWVRILHHYVSALDFTGLVFDEAIRLFLSGFRLPGEAQKIDRIMEKFAERYTAQNPSVFHSADTAFILAFSVIMLNTDLHNPSIKPERRMTLESFIKNNRGIGENDSDLPKKFLKEIFDRIKERPFSLKEDDAARERAGAQKQIFDSSVFFENTALFGLSAEQRKRETFKKEKDELMALTEQLIRRRPEKNARVAPSASAGLDAVAPAEVIKPMFDVTWGPVLGTLSQVLEFAEEDRIIQVCLNGIVYAVRIASHNRMSLARDTFMSTLAKFTFLGSVKEMKKKNVDSVRALLTMALVDGEFLDESWEPVLQCISQLCSFVPPKGKKQPSTPRKDIVSRDDVAKAVLQSMQEALVDKIYASTVNLSARSLAHFIAQLITVSRSEIDGSSKRAITGVDGGNTSAHGSDGPSIYSLQRLVEVADFNLDVRARLVWAQIWEMMGDFFAEVACNRNAVVSVFAVDSLKQLSIKFLDKPELAEFNFQRIFLKPFLTVMATKESREDVRELVLQCIDNIVRNKSHNLRSGWKVVFSVLRESANDPSEKIEYMGLGILQRLLDEHLHELCTLTNDRAESDSDGAEESIAVQKQRRNSNVEDFVALCRASLSFVGRDAVEARRPIGLGLSMRAFCHTSIYADLLAAGRVLPPVSGAQHVDATAPGYTYADLSEEESLQMVPWRPLLDGLAYWVCSSVKSTVGGVGCLLQRGSVLALRAIFLRHGHLFSATQWVAILQQTLLPAIQTGAESDESPVLDITSESPFVSSIDFLVESVPLPPPPDDKLLLFFEAGMSSTSTSKRGLGSAELMLEASFTDLRHGGDGDLRRAYLLAKKESASLKPKSLEEPFPTSWLATTAPLALGLLTDIASEMAVCRSDDGRDMIWPLIARQYKMWCIGRSQATGRWAPCEAVVRVACRELQRFATRLGELLPSLDGPEKLAWTTLVFELYSQLINESVRVENTLRETLVHKRLEALGRKAKQPMDPRVDEIIQTPYGQGKLLRIRNNPLDWGADNRTLIIQLAFGGTLYLTESTATGSRKEDARLAEVGTADKLLASLKIRAIALHCLHRSLLSILHAFISIIQKPVLSSLIRSLNLSRAAAERAVSDGDVAIAFQEALLASWGGGDVDEMQRAIEGSSHVQGSAMFFLTQEAGATHATISMLSMLYSGIDFAPEAEKWDREAFSELYLFPLIQDVITKFVASEKRDGHLIAPNVWRNSSESGGKAAFYCTSFAAVVVNILSVLMSLRTEQFSKHAKDVFPRLCDLVGAQSAEIRQLVMKILSQHIAPLIA